MSQRFRDDQKSVLRDVLETLIPPSEDGRLPGAGQLGLAEAIDAALDGTPALRDPIAQGLADLGDFAALPASQRAARLEEHALSHPAFVPGLTFHAYAAYYVHPRVLAGLGMEARPPCPEGYTMEPDDDSLIEPVRERPKLYREVSGGGST